MPIGASAGTLPPAPPRNALHAHWPPRPAAGSGSASGRGAAVPRATDVLIALPVAEEAERATLLAIIRRARDATAKATGASGAGDACG